MRLVFLSDNHMHFNFPVPKGDYLIHCGDMTFKGTHQELIRTNLWFEKLKRENGFKAVYYVWGNHELLADKDELLAKIFLSSAICIHEKQLILEGVKFYGSSYQPFFYNWAFNLPRGEELKRVWARIPDDTQILITHTGPKNILDFSKYSNENVGCQDLFDRVEKLKDLKLHVMGHIHGARNHEFIDSTLFINASICDEKYRPMNKPYVVDLFWQNNKLHTNLIDF